MKHHRLSSDKNKHTSLFFMATFTTYRALFIQVMTGDAELVGGCLAPVIYFPCFVSMTFPAFVSSNLLMFMVSELNGLSPHLQFYNLRTFVFRHGSNYGRGKQDRK